MTVVWNEEQANRHPEWRQLRPDGRAAGRLPVGPIGTHDWQWLCLNSPYADHVSAVAAEVLNRYPVDDLFLDIVMTVQPGCVCGYCRRGMQEVGLDPTDEGGLRRYTLTVEHHFMERISREVWARHPDLPLFFNSRLRLAGDPALGNRTEAPSCSAMNPGCAERETALH